jgi:tRNA threonylcarbamoyladenosine biosynthesis protein TsaB
MTPMSAPPPALALTLLAIETSTELASVALLHRGQLSSRASSGAQTHSMSVPAMVQALLADAGLKLAQCSALAFGMGPGSFTGVRTACGLVQGLAFGASLRVAPVVTLVAMAETARQSGAGNEVLAVLDARMGEVYWAQYRFDAAGDGRWHSLSEPTLSAASEVTAIGTPAVCGNGLSAYPEGFARFAKLQRMPDIMPHAEAVATLAAAMVDDDQLLAARDAQPLYLRNKVALTTAERMAAQTGSVHAASAQAAIMPAAIAGAGTGTGEITGAGA